MCSLKFRRECLFYLEHGVVSNRSLKSSLDPTQDSRRNTKGGRGGGIAQGNGGGWMMIEDFSFHSSFLQITFWISHPVQHFILSGVLSIPLTPPHGMSCLPRSQRTPHIWDINIYSIALPRFVIVGIRGRITLVLHQHLKCNAPVTIIQNRSLLPRVCSSACYPPPPWRIMWHIGAK